MRSGTAKVDFRNRRGYWLERAEALTPELRHWSLRPRGVVTGVADPGAFQGVRMESGGGFAELRERQLQTGESVTVDFGETAVGRLEITLEVVGPNDGPIRLRLVAAELPYEAVTDFATYHGVLSRAWLQEEVLTIDYPGTIRLPRRYSLRYLKLEVLAVNGAVRFRDLVLHAESAAGAELPVAPGLTPELRKLDEVGLRTLRNCMQTVLEDGPKRDRRLWLGDLRLQAQVNAVSFRKPELVERSLYLLAGLSDDEGRCPGAAYEFPVPRRSNDVVDYALLLAPTLLDHWNFYGREEVVRELYELARHQFDLVRPDFGADGLYRLPSTQWVFIDHREGLERAMALQGVYLYGLKALIELAKHCGHREEVSAFAAEYDCLREAMRSRALDPATMLIHSGAERQISYASQIWAILAGVLTPEEGRRSLASLEQLPEAVPPATPYLYHHLLAAFRRCGEEEKLQALLRHYWGGMAARGADTFFEIYVPDDDFYSPYGDALINSACHAWSCTSSCFLRNCEAGN